MQVNFSLTLSQTQKLIMTPELRQAIAILQLSALELDAFVEQELMENPLLDIAEEQKSDDLSDSPFREEAQQENEDNKDTKERDSVDWEEYLQDCSDTGFPKLPRVNRDEGPSFENFVSLTPTLQEHLMLQLHLSGISECCIRIGAFLIGNIDKNGYLTIEVSEASKILKVSKARVTEVLKVIQSFDPGGVGARSLKECLLIQIDQRDIDVPGIKPFVLEHLQDVAEGKFSRIAEAMGISLSQVQRLRDVVLTLDPKPGRNYSSDNAAQYIVPDAVIERAEGKYVVTMNDNISPRLFINPYYRSLLSSEDKDSAISQFLTDRLDSALWLIKSIEQRRATLFRVITAIAEVQQEFLDHGLEHLKPLNMKQIADRVKVHESTVSRAINGKYVQTPRGIIDLKFFFQSGLECSNGTPISAESIKKVLRGMIDDEDDYNPLSDQKIADDMDKRGIVISRRTVAKYRDEMGIPSSAKRRRY